MIVAAAVLWVLAAYLSVYVGYQLLLFAANAWIPDAPEFVPDRFRSFNVVVPSHDEELYLPRLLTSLRLQEYPAGQYRVTVVADNCTDGTVAACGAFDVDVLERHDDAARGKGQAIQWALEKIGSGQWDAIVIVDGDSIVAPDFLKHLNLTMARGDRVIQCYNGVANPGQSWFTRLMDVSRTISNVIVHPGKRKLGLSSHLMGNGMCFDTRVLSAHGWNAFSVGEDWEYYARLILSGEHIGYSKFSRVYHQESVNLRQASSQRMRWSSGRFAVLGRYGPSLFMQGLRDLNWTYIDASLPLVLPNPSLGINLTVIGLVLAGAYAALGGGGFVVWYCVLAAAQFMMFIVGVFHTSDWKASAMSLVLAPLFLVWKLGIDVLSLLGIGRKEWTRTERRLP